MAATNISKVYEYHCLVCDTVTEVSDLIVDTHGELTCPYCGSDDLEPALN